jgi:hypothetical protein
LIGSGYGRRRVGKEVIRTWAEITPLSHGDEVTQKAAPPGPTALRNSWLKGYNC